MAAITRALLSVSDKTGIVDLARGLVALGIEIVSTGGTARLLGEADVPVREVAELTGFPEILGGRVKTLHPHVHGGLLARRSLPGDMEELAAHGIGPIDLVAVNLYPFEATIADPDVRVDAALEEIDIGGVTLIRAAAKNYRDVLLLSDPADYAAVLAELQLNGGTVGPETRLRGARAGFAHTAAYDAAIATWFAGGLEPGAFPERLILSGAKLQDLRYGENPHQAGALYRAAGATDGWAGAVQLSGSAMSYCNYWDASGALRAVGEFDRPACVVVKHATPCGVAEADTLPAAIRAAIDGDPVSAFGGVVACNRPIDDVAAAVLTAPNQFLEVICAPDVEDAARARITARSSWGDRVRLFTNATARAVAGQRLFRSVPGGLLAMTDDAGAPEDWRVATQRPPTAAERADLELAWRVAKHVTSNAIVLAKGSATVGIGAGQMSRVDATAIAIQKAGDRVAGSVLASDAFFPFPDSIEQAVAAGVTAFVQPGGSKKDAVVIAAADAAGVAMVLTGARHFRH